MSEGLNQVTLFGNLGADPELKLTAKGPVLKMRLATEESWRNKETNAKEKRTEWHRLTMFGTRAESIARHLKKGARIMVQGHLRTDSYDKEGQKHYRTEIIVDEVRFGGGPANGAYMPAPKEAVLGSAEVPF